MAFENRCSVLPFADVIAELEARAGQVPSEMPPELTGFHQVQRGRVWPRPWVLQPRPLCYRSWEIHLSSRRRSSW